MIKIRPITNNVLSELEKVMAEDKHSMLCQTHVVYRDTTIIGSLSLGVIPLCTMWMDSKRAKVRETLSVIQSAEAILSDRSRNGVNLPLVIVPCDKESPLFPYVPKLGYKQLRSLELFMKEL